VWSGRDVERSADVESRAVAASPRLRRRLPDVGDSAGRNYQHGRVEVYDRRGRHLGEFDPASGQRL